MELGRDFETGLELALEIESHQRGKFGILDAQHHLEIEVDAAIVEI